MGQDPDRIREQIDETRDRMGETVDAIGYKADVPSRMKESVTGAKDTVVSKVSGAMPDTESVKQGARRGAVVARENPVGLAIGGLAVGFLAGLALPSTRMEDERLGEVSDQVIDAARETGSEALERGTEVAREAGAAAADQVKERAPGQAEELQSSLQREVRGMSTETSP
jgi:Protein of unknown function (DUF3618)